MSNIKIDGHPITTNGSLPSIGHSLPPFKLITVKNRFANLSDFAGKNIILNIFPSVGTGVCAAAVRRFNAIANELDNTVVLCISKDLPFAQAQFCAAEGLDNVIMLSDYASGDFGRTYGVEIQELPFYKLLARSVVVTDAKGKVIYNQLVPETGDEPDYEAALAALK